MWNRLVLARKAGLSPYKEETVWHSFRMIAPHQVLTWKLSIVETEMLRSSVTSDLWKRFSISATCRHNSKILHRWRNKPRLTCSKQSKNVCCHCTSSFSPACLPCQDPCKASTRSCSSSNHRVVFIECPKAIDFASTTLKLGLKEARSRHLLI